jgi:FAD/FMN-containing dehydrogenase
MKIYQSWGRYPKFTPHHVIRPNWREEFFFSHSDSYLCYGLGRSYGDSCLNSNGTLIDTTGLSKIIHFNYETGLLRCESGVSIADILREYVSHGWFVPVTPGTKFITIGGAIANDIHGKNHHQAGNFGNHVTQFELLRSDGKRLICSRSQNSELFAATIGGLGLTGMITWAEFQMKKISSSMIVGENSKFGTIDEFLMLSAESNSKFEYSVAWIDCASSGRKLGRGIFMQGNHKQAEKPDFHWKEKQIPFPIEAPNWILNSLTIKKFNTLYFNKQFSKIQRTNINFDTFFYPLDSILGWNKMYGKRGFLQYQLVIPFENGSKILEEILRRIATSGEGSFLAVLKTFGTIPAEGMMSFPRPGITLALDFGFNGERTLKLLEHLDSLVREAGGAVYPAKDARMSHESFIRFFPKYREFLQYIDPHFISDFWKRVTTPT